MVIDQLVIAGVLVALVVLGGPRAGLWLVPLVVIPAGLTYPLSFGGFTSMIPALVPGELLPPANAVETTSFNVGARGRPRARRAPCRPSSARRRR